MRFSAVFSTAAEYQPDKLIDPDDLTTSFYSTCLRILDTVAPVKMLHPKLKTEPWLTDVTHVSRRAERKWKKDKLQVSFDILKDSWVNYQRIVQPENTEYFSNIVFQNNNNPRKLFNTLHPPITAQQSFFFSIFI